MPLAAHRGRTRRQHPDNLADFSVDSPAMSAAPLNVFSHRIAPEVVVEVLRRFGAVTLDGGDDSWTRATLSLKTGWVGRTSIVVTHSVEYYSGPGWPQQVHGMRGYFARLRHDAEVERVIGGLRFCVAVLEAADAIEKADKRLAVVAALAEALDGVVFSPGYLFDAKLRVLVSHDGERDPAAVLPRYPTNLFAATPGGDPLSGEDDEYHDEEPNPPSPERVARRALVMAAVTARALSENHEEDDLPGLRRDVWKWVEDCGVVDECEPHEVAYLRCPERPEDRATLDACWRVEGLGILLWALGHTDLQPNDTLVTPTVLWKAAGLFGSAEAGAAFIANATLRSADELDALNTHLLAFHWRMVDFRLRRASMDFIAFSQKCWFGSFSLDGFEIVDGDLALAGKRIDRASPQSVQAAGSTAMERHLASNWLKGYSDVYSETDVST